MSNEYLKILDMFERGELKGFCEFLFIPNSSDIFHCKVDEKLVDNEDWLKEKCLGLDRFKCKYYKKNKKRICKTCIYGRFWRLKCRLLWKCIEMGKVPMPAGFPAGCPKLEQWRRRLKRAMMEWEEMEKEAQRKEAQ